jgi:hypothetical protein
MVVLRICLVNFVIKIILLSKIYDYCLVKNIIEIVVLH